MVMFVAEDGIAMTQPMSLAELFRSFKNRNKFTVFKYTASFYITISYISKGSRYYGLLSVWLFVM